MNIKIKTGSYFGTDEWMMKEYGSWEEKGEKADHPCAILQREMDKPVMDLTKEEAETLLESVTYHVNAGWDGFDSPKEKFAFIQTLKGYKARLEKALAKI